MQPYIGQITMFGGNFAPRGWAFCEGQLLAISQNDALFSILGTIYGGDGRTTFGLPDLKGRVPVHAGNGPGLSDRRLGAKSGTPNNVLTSNNLPFHSHALGAVNPPQNAVTIGVNTGTANSSNPTTGAFAAGAFYSGQAADGRYAHLPHNFVASGGTTSSGSSSSMNNIQPSLVIHFIVALVGVYPSRN